MSKALCPECSGSGCRYCGGLGVLVCECQPESQEPPTFAEYYHDEIERAGYIRLADDEVVVKRATAETAYSWVRGFGGSLGMIHDDFDAVADLERALEGRP